MLRGLSSQDAAERFSKYGPNDPAPAKRGAAVIELLLLFVNPLVVILLIASVVSSILGSAKDAVIILVMVLLGVSINFVQTYRSQRAIDKLRANVTPTATVLRDGRWQEINRHEVVPGDIVRMSAGDLVPADGQLLESHDLYVQQAALTGESLPAEKMRLVMPPARREPRCAGSCLSWNLGRQRYRYRSDSEDWSANRVWSHCRTASDAPGRNRVRAQYEALWNVDHARRIFLGFIHSSDSCRIA